MKFPYNFTIMVDTWFYHWMGMIPTPVTWRVTVNPLSSAGLLQDSRVDFIHKTGSFFSDRTGEWGMRPTMAQLSTDLQPWPIASCPFASELNSSKMNSDSCRWVNGVVRFGSEDPLLQAVGCGEWPAMSWRKLPDNPPRWKQDPCRNRFPKRTGIRRPLWGCCHMGYAIC